MSAPLPAGLRHAQRMLPWHVNHTLEAADEARVQTALASSPRLKAEALWLQSFATLLREEPARRSGDQGLATLLARLHAEQSGKVVVLPVLPVRRRAWHKPALALAAAVMLAQAGVIVNLLARQDPTGDTRPLAVTPVAGNLLQITFRHTTTEPQLRAALAQVGGVLVSGPGQLGVYTVRVDGGPVGVALASLLGNPSVNTATLLAPH